MKTRRAIVVLVSIFAGIFSYTFVAQAQTPQLESYTQTGNSSTLCYADGCINFNFVQTPNWTTLYPGSTLAQVFSNAIAQANAEGDSTSNITNAAGNLIYVACGNGHVHTATYNCSYQLSCSGNDLVDYCGDSTTCEYGCSDNECNPPPDATSTACDFNGIPVLNGQSITAYQNYISSITGSCVSETRTCDDGTLSGSYQYSSCTDNGGLGTVVYSCSGNNVINTSNGQTIASCTSPSYCSPGDSQCVTPPPGYITFGGGVTQDGVSGNNSAQTTNGAFTAKPNIVRTGQTSSLFWNVQNVQPNTCLVTGTDGETLKGTDLEPAADNVNSSGAAGIPTGPISTDTIFTLTCTGYDGTTFTGSSTVQVAPNFNEQ